MCYLSRRLMSRFPLSKTVYFPPEAIRLAFFRHVNLGCGAPSGRHLDKKRNLNLFVQPPKGPCTNDVSTQGGRGVSQFLTQ